MWNRYRHITFMSCPSFPWNNPETVQHFVWRLPCFLSWLFIIQNLSVECSRYLAGTKSNAYLEETHAWLWKQNLFPVSGLKRGTYYFIGWLQNRVLLSFCWRYAKGCTHPLRPWQHFLIQERNCRAKFRV